MYYSQLLQYLYCLGNKLITFLRLLCMVETKSEATHILVISQS